MDHVGHVVTWRVPSKVALAALVAALGEAGIPEDMAGDLHPRHALARALRDLAREAPRIARRLAPDASGRPRMQLTREYTRGAGLEYDREAILTLDGVNVLPDEPAAQPVATEAARLLSEHLGQRLTSDLTRLVQRVVESAGTDLVPIRDQGGAYFIPRGAAVVAQLSVLLERIGGKLALFAVTLGHGSDDSIATTLADYLLGQIAELRASCAEVGADARSDVRARRLDKVAGLRSRLGAYRTLLAATAENVGTALDAAETELLAKLTAAPMPEAAPETTPETADAALPAPGEPYPLPF